MIFHLLGQIKIHDNDENVFCTQVKSTLQHFGRIVKTVKYLKKYWKDQIGFFFWQSENATFLDILNQIVFA